MLGIPELRCQEGPRAPQGPWLECAPPAPPLKSHSSPAAKPYSYLLDSGVQVGKATPVVLESEVTVRTVTMPTV